MEAQMAPAEHGHVIEGEEGHHEKKSVLKKVKDKAVKIKDTLKRHGHGHDDEGENDEDEEEEKDDERVHDPEVHGASVFESTTAQEGQGGHPLQEDPNQPGAGMDSPAKYQAKTTDLSSTGGAEAHVGPVTRSFQEMKVSEEPEKTEDSPTGSHDQFSPTTPPSEPTPTQAKPEPAPEHPQSYTDKITSAASAISGKASSAASTVYEAVAGKTVQGPEEGKGKEDRGVSVRDYLVGKLSPGEEDKALSEVLSDVIHKRREGETLVRTEGVVETEKGVVRKEEGVVGKIKGAVTSLFRKGESGGSSSSPEVQQGQGEIHHEDTEGRRLQESGN